MSAVDFGAWARPDLVFTLGGVAYAVKPPSVAAMRQVLALAVRAEVGRDRLPEEIRDVLDELPSDSHPALGGTYQELVDAGVDPETISRVGVYATLFWARGREYADFIAEAVWGPERDLAKAEAGGARPKGSKSGRRRTGPSTASVNRSTTTSKASPSSRTTGKSPAKPKS